MSKCEHNMSGWTCDCGDVEDERCIKCGDMGSQMVQEDLEQRLEACLGLLTNIGRGEFSEATAQAYARELAAGRGKR